MSRKPLLRQSLKSGLSACMGGCMLQSNAPDLAGVVGRFSSSRHFSLTSIGSTPPSGASFVIGKLRFDHRFHVHLSLAICLVGLHEF
jgi:hypothetical protein